MTERRGPEPAADTTSWRETIDGWVCDPDVRRHALLGLGIVVTGIVAAAGIATGILGVMLTMMPSELVKNIAVGMLGAGSAGWWLRRRRRPATTETGPDQASTAD